MHTKRYFNADLKPVRGCLVSFNLSWIFYLPLLSPYSVQKQNSDRKRMRQHRGRQNRNWKPGQKGTSFKLKIAWFLSKQWGFLEHFCFHKTDLPFIPAPRDKQTGGCNLYLKSSAWVLALSNTIANKEWQLVPSAALVFLIWITSASNETNRSVRIRHQTPPAFGHFCPASHLTTNCHLQVIYQQVVPISKNTEFTNACSKPQTEALYI